MNSNKKTLLVETLVEDLKSEDFKKRINSIENLHIIALHLGKERTRAELIPYFKGNVKKNLMFFKKKKIII